MTKVKLVPEVLNILNGDPDDPMGRMLFIDIETFGLNVENDPPLEVGVKLVNLALEEIDSVSFLIWDNLYTERFDKEEAELQSLSDEQKTKAAFINNPLWSTTEGVDRRFYKTGDLIKYNEDGDLLFIERKDTQIKLNGQRIEVGEVEHHALQVVSEDQTCAVDVVNKSANSKALAVFFTAKGDKIGDDTVLLTMSSDADSELSQLIDALQSTYVGTKYWTSLCTI